MNAVWRGFEDLIAVHMDQVILSATKRGKSRLRAIHLSFHCIRAAAMTLVTPASSNPAGCALLT